MKRQAIEIEREFDEKIQQKNNDNNIAKYEELFYGILNLLESLYSDYQANRDKIYSRSIGIITFCSAVFSLSFINYPNNLLLQLDNNPGLFVICMINLTFLVVSFLLLTISFIRIFWTRNHDKIDENTIVYEKVEDYYKYDIGVFVSTLNKEYKKQVTSIKEYVSKIEKDFRVLLILSILLIVFSIINLVISSFMISLWLYFYLF